MSSRSFHCEGIRSAVERRSVLLGLAALASLLPLESARAGSGFRIRDLVDGQGGASELARSLIGQSVSLRGYLAPSIDGTELPLSEASPAPCQLCGSLHDPGFSVTILPERGAASLPVFEPVEVTGRLEVRDDAEPGVRLSDARVVAL